MSLWRSDKFLLTLSVKKKNTKILNLDFPVSCRANDNVLYGTNMLSWQKVAVPGRGHGGITSPQKTFAPQTKKSVLVLIFLNVNVTKHLFKIVYAGLITSKISKRGVDFSYVTIIKYPSISDIIVSISDIIVFVTCIAFPTYYKTQRSISLSSLMNTLISRMRIYLNVKLLKLVKRIALHVCEQWRC